jgi:hypothetical protein
MSVISIHRLPRRYRYSLVMLWLTPLLILLGTLLLVHGWIPALLDPRLWLLLGMMALPALYIWQEGVDVLPEGVIIRQHVPRFYRYEALETWYIDTRPLRKLLTLWDVQQRAVLRIHSSHLSDLPTLIAALQTHLRYRGWPE